MRQDRTGPRKAPVWIDRTNTRANEEARQRGAEPRRAKREDGRGEGEKKGREKKMTSQKVKVLGGPMPGSMINDARGDGGDVVWIVWASEG